MKIAYILCIALISIPLQSAQVIQPLNKRPLTKMLIEAVKEGDTIKIIAIEKQIYEAQERAAQKCEHSEESINGTDDAGRTAIIWAALLGKKAAVATLLDLGADVVTLDREGLGVFSAARQNAQDTGDQSLLIDLIIETLPSFIEHAQEGDTDLQWFIAAGMPIDQPDSSGKTALMYAAEHGNEDAVNVLIALEANVNARDHHNVSVIRYAINHPHIVARLLQAGAQLDTSLTKIARPALKKVIQPYIAFEKRDLVEQLMEASEKGDFDMVKNIILYGKIDPNSTDDRGWTALDWAAFRGHTELITDLLLMGAHPDPIFDQFAEKNPQIKKMLEDFKKKTYRKLG